MTIMPPPMPPGVKNPPDHVAKSWRPAAPRNVRREIALRYGATPGETVETRCQYCPTVGLIRWPRLSSGAIGSVVHFNNLTLDHIVPLSNGGSNDDSDNYVLACGPCNSSKWNRGLDGWMAAR